MSSEPYPPAARPGAVPSRPRQRWADVAKGACIALVVLWHVIVKHYLRIEWHLGVPLPGVWGTLGEQLLPLRMPLFFTISGLFAANAVDRPWRRVGRSRIARFLYLYAGWLLIHTLLLAAAPDFPTDRAGSVTGLLAQLTVSPSNLWYLYALALYFAVAKLARRVPVPVLLAAAAGLSAASTAGLLATAGNRGGVYQNLVFFLGGLHLRPYLSRWVATATRRRLLLTAAGYLAALAGMAWTGAQGWPGVWLLVSVAAVAFGLTAAARLARWRRLGDPLAALGRRTLPVYVLHLPLLALADRVLHGPLSGLGRSGQFALALGYPILLTSALLALTLALHRGLLLLRAGWMFDLPAPRPAGRRRRPRSLWRDGEVPRDRSGPDGGQVEPERRLADAVPPGWRG
ncbi:pyridoxal-5'-phosphate-dependent protein subunit beta [Plantactinospora sp. BC1]|uniref:acyltransferase family protein n=1 Tax=Plantactinospora sp. BC1 TaxID=2108470 RepID=UPI000D15AB6E|nr:acyltransferase family protein [Plantactinospora sp. BC1]AVT31711.1 pyridoxal-5'-phosphate-dependent protein subunit beta [Plantactinospora sp. BC1]